MYHTWLQVSATSDDDEDEDTVDDLAASDTYLQPPAMARAVPCQQITCVQVLVLAARLRILALHMCVNPHKISQI